MARYKIDCCFNCADRKPGCHGTCEKYKQQRAEYDAKKAEIRKKADVEHGITGSIYDSVRKTTKHRIYRSKFRKGH